MKWQANNNNNDDDKGDSEMEVATTSNPIRERINPPRIQKLPLRNLQKNPTECVCTYIYITQIQTIKSPIINNPGAPKQYMKKAKDKNISFRYI